MTMVSEIQKIQSIKQKQKLSSLTIISTVSFKGLFWSWKRLSFYLFFFSFGILPKHKHSELKDIGKCQGNVI